jgi:hypothetical protein
LAAELSALLSVESVVSVAALLMVLSVAT